MTKTKSIKKSVASSSKKEQKDNHQFALLLEHILLWQKKKLIPQKLAKNYLKIIEQNSVALSQQQELKNYNQNAIQKKEYTLLDIPKILNSEEQKHHEETNQALLDLNNFVLSNWNLLLSHLVDAHPKNKGLFNKVDLESSFGISRKITDLMYYLQELLERSQLKHIQNTEYEIEGRVNNCAEEDIVLKYEFTASNIDEAIKIFTNYKRTMISRGLKIWLAYWRIGNELHRVEYAVPMIDVMRKLTNDNRKTDYFSVQEKQQHWEITKMLRRTTLSIEKQYKQKGTGKTITRWLERPLLEILGGEKDIAMMDKYPEKIAVKILKTEKSTKGFAPAIFKNETLLADYNDTYLSFIIQVKSSHDRAKKNIKIEWEYLFLYGGLEATANSNKRAAKVKMSTKLDRLKNAKIIEDWQKVADGVIITPNKALYNNYD